MCEWSGLLSHTLTRAIWLVYEDQYKKLFKTGDAMYYHQLRHLYGENYITIYELSIAN